MTVEFEAVCGPQVYIVMRRCRRPLLVANTFARWSISFFRGKGASPINHCWYQTVRDWVAVWLSCRVVSAAVHRLVFTARAYAGAVLCHTRGLWQI